MTTLTADKSIQFGEIEITVDSEDRSTGMYAGAGWYEEFNSPFLQQVAHYIRPEIMLDIGANYGVAATFMKNTMTDVPLIAIEANPALIPYIEANLAANNLTGEVLYAVAGAEPLDAVSFHVNPNASQDSRVVPAGARWKEVSPPQVSIDSLLLPRDVRSAYIKIDCQGFEEPIFRGAEEFLGTSANWLIKTEFAPKWLMSQGTDPLEFLSHLVSLYVVAEMPGRFGFGFDYRDILDRHAIKPGEEASFLNYLSGLNRNNRGWVDLLIAPKS